MNGLALLGILVFVYAAFIFFVAFKKPEKIWSMAKIEGFKKVLGEKGTIIFFNIWGILAVAFGLLLSNSNIHYKSSLGIIQYQGYFYNEYLNLRNDFKK